MKALLIVDMQVMPFIWKDYGGKALHNEEQLITTARTVISEARAAGAPLIYIMHTEKGDSPRQPGQPLWEVHPELAPEKEDYKVVKYHTDSFIKTDLHDILDHLNIKKLVVMGVQTEFCVDTICRTASSRGYSIELIQNGHSTFDTETMSAREIIELHNKELAAFARIIDSRNIRFS